MKNFVGEETKIIQEVMPVILRDKKTSWRLEMINDTLFIKWSVCKELIDVGINAIDEFKIRTNIGEHKVSMFLRNVYKYCAEVDYWYLDKEKCIDKCIIRTNEINLDKNIVAYDIIVRSSNCENNQYELVKILNMANSKGYNIPIELCTINTFLSAIITENTNNVRFTSFLFHKS